ncbi:hypothetical protein [Catenulispora rubra]|uniref:hypothetical protein n=1 Tax=Catenulispora rubra TaxID=280293 RepID=UPI0018927442|nr:hypothetical protein [Catenulispora rubra]
MTAAATVGDRIDMGDGRVGIVVEVRGANLYTVSWSGGARSLVAPDNRARIEPGYFARLVEEAAAATRAARSQAAQRGWAIRRACAVGVSAATGC